MLLTSTDFARRESYVNAGATLRRLLGWHVVPVVNENDTTGTDEIRFGDNDVLAAQVAIMLRADLLVLLTDRDGVFTADPGRDSTARLVERLDDEDLVSAAALEGSGARGVGGMAGKVAAARMAAAADVRTVIASGARDDVIRCAVSGEAVGTLARAAADRRVCLQALAALREACAWYARDRRRRSPGAGVHGRQLAAGGRDGGARQLLGR